MKNFKILLFLIPLCWLGASPSAQTFSIKAGINRANLSDFRGDRYSSLINTDPEMSFHLETSMSLP